ITCAVVRRGTGFHANQAGRQRRKKLQHLAASQSLPDDDLLGRIDAVDLKHVFGDIQTDCGNLHVDSSLMWFVATITLRRFVAGSGRRPPHQNENPPISGLCQLPPAADMKQVIDAVAPDTEDPGPASEQTGCITKDSKNPAEANVIF